MRKCLALFIAVMVLLGLTGCGEKVVGVPNPTFGSGTTSDTQNSESYATNNNSATTPEVTPETPSGADSGLEPENDESKGDTSGIFFYTLTDSIAQYTDYTIYQVSPDTGIINQVVNFRIPADGHRFAGKDTTGTSHSVLRNSAFMFSHDFDKCATDYEFVNGEIHAGWIDANGNFFDVNQAVGDASTSEFDAPKHFIALGFTPDNQFTYYDRDNKEFYYVDVDRPNVSHPGDPIRDIFGDALDTLFEFERFSDWLDSEHLLGDMLHSQIISGYSGAIYDVASDSYTRILPSDSPRMSRGFVCSPDGNSLAFFSCLADWQDNALFIMPVNGSPQRLETTGDVDISLYGNKSASNLLCWR